MENNGKFLWSFGIFYGHLEYFTVNWNILLRSFVVFYGLLNKFCGHLIYFSPFWYVLPRIIWQPCGVPVRWHCRVPEPGPSGFLAGPRQSVAKVKKIKQTEAT
jgi:hypothetical protein